MANLPEHAHQRTQKEENLFDAPRHWGNDTIHAFVQERNALDIELYKYAVDINLKKMRAAGVSAPSAI
jgi:hypothetical protein